MMIARTLDFQKYFSSLLLMLGCCAVCVTYGSTSKFSRSRRACFPFIVFVSLVLCARDPAMCSDPEKRLASPVIAHRTHKHTLTHDMHGRRMMKSLSKGLSHVIWERNLPVSSCNISLIDERRRAAAICAVVRFWLCLFHVNPNKVILPTLTPASPWVYVW